MKMTITENQYNFRSSQNVDYQHEQEFLAFEKYLVLVFVTMSNVTNVLFQSALNRDNLVPGT